MAKVGDIIGGYRLIAEIGIGGFASVFTGKHILFQDKPIVAIKVLHKHFTSLEQQDLLIQEALQEAQLLVQLKHPHILSVLDAGIHDQSLYLITEFAPNGSLDDRLRRQKSKRLPLAEAIQILSQIGQALNYAHERKIVHCDLKPDNILFNAKGDALLADFGIAAVLTSGETKDVGRRGTIYYMAPEQFAGKASPKSDQYALGCIAYELFTGQRLFAIPHPTPEQMWYQHAKVEPSPLRQLNPQLPVHLEQAVLKAVAKDRKNRYTTTEEFIAALQKSSQEWLQEGKNLFNQKRYKEAVFAFEQAIQMDTDAANALFHKGYTSILLGNYNEAAKAYVSATMLDPDLLFTHIIKDELPHFLELNSYEEVLATIGQTIIHILDQHLQSDSHLILTQIFKAVWFGLQIIFLKGGEYELPNRYEEEILHILDRTIELAPSSSLAYFAKVVILEMLDRDKESKAVLDEIIELVPDSLFDCLISYCGLMIWHRESENTAILDQITKLGSDSPLAFFAKVSALSMLARNEEAEASLKQVIGLAPNSLLAYLTKIIALSDLNHVEDAEVALDQIIEFVSNPSLAYLAKAVILAWSDYEEEAEATFDQAITSAPKSQLVLLVKAIRLITVEEEAEAFAIFDRMISLVPKSPFAYIAKAIVLILKGEEEKALTVLDQATRLDPDFILTHSLKIYLLYGLDRKEETLPVIEQILHLIPSSAIVHSLKAFVLYELDRVEEALNAMEQVLHLLPSSALAHHFKAHLLYKFNYMMVN